MVLREAYVMFRQNNPFKVLISLPADQAECITRSVSRILIFAVIVCVLAGWSSGIVDIHDNGYANIRLNFVFMPWLLGSTAFLQVISMLLVMIILYHHCNQSQLLIDKINDLSADNGITVDILDSIIDDVYRVKQSLTATSTTYSSCIALLFVTLNLAGLLTINSLVKILSDKDDSVVVMYIVLLIFDMMVTGVNAYLFKMCSSVNQMNVKICVAVDMMRVRLRYL